MSIAPASDASVVDRVATDRAGHAVSAAPPSAKFGAINGNDLDAGFAQQSVGEGIPVISEHHTRGCTDEVGAGIPLRAFTQILAASGLDDAKSFRPNASLTVSTRPHEPGDSDEAENGGGAHVCPGPGIAGINACALYADENEHRNQHGISDLRQQTLFRHSNAAERSEE